MLIKSNISAGSVELHERAASTKNISLWPNSPCTIRPTDITTEYLCRCVKVISPLHIGYTLISSTKTLVRKYSIFLQYGVASFQKNEIKYHLWNIFPVLLQTTRISELAPSTATSGTSHFSVRSF